MSLSFSLLILCLLGLLFTAQCMGIGMVYEWADESYGPIGSGISLMLYFGIWFAVIFAIIGLPEECK